MIASKSERLVNLYRLAKERHGSGRIVLVHSCCGDWFAFGLDAIKVSKTLGILRFSVRCGGDLVRCVRIEGDLIHASIRKLAESSVAITVVSDPNTNASESPNEEKNKLESKDRGVHERS